MKRSLRRTLPLLAALAALAAGREPLAAAERAFAAWRTLADRVEVTRARGATSDLDGTPLAQLETRRDAARERARVGSSRVALAATATDDERRALAALTAALADTHGGDSDPAGPEAKARQALYAAFAAAAAALPFEDESLDRLSVLGRLAREEDPVRRRRLFAALAPLWRAVDGDGGTDSPYRRLLPASARAWRERGSPAAAGIRALGVDPDVMEGWLLQLLAGWRDHAAVAGEPWDYWHAAGRASRVLAAAVPLPRLRAINDAYHRALGADPAALGIRYDLAPRAGKTPVAFTTYGSRRRPEAWIFATYREGGFDNLVELLHETGHGLHVSATFAARPAFRDWPDADPFTEGVGDLLAHEAYEPAWQQRWLGTQVASADALRAKYAGVVLDVAWALFEIRLHRDPDADPNAVWTAITSEYLKLAPHPELSWWALRGQLVDAPGYMANYAAGAFVTAALRERVRGARGAGAMTGGDASFYPWLARELLRFGRARPTADVLAAFLGGPLRPEPLLRDLARAGRD